MRERFYDRLQFGCGGAHISRAMLYSYGCGGALSAPETLFASRAASMDFAADVGEWLSLVEHLVRDQGVGGSNPLSPTNSNQSSCAVFLPARNPNPGGQSTQGFS